MADAGAAMIQKPQQLSIIFKITKLIETKHETLTLNIIVDKILSIGQTQYAQINIDEFDSRKKKKEKQKKTDAC